MKKEFTSEVRMSLEECKKHILPNTHKCLCMELNSNVEEIEALKTTMSTDSQKNRNDEYNATRDRIENLNARNKEILILLSTRRIYYPNEQRDFVALGSGPKISFPANGVPAKYFLVDSIVAGKNKNVITLNAPLGEAIFGKPVGYQGKCIVNNREVLFLIEEILTFSEAKIQVLHSANPIQDFEPIPASVPAK